MLSSSWASCGSYSRELNNARTVLPSSSSSAGTSSVVWLNSLRAAAMTSGVGIAAWTICCSSRPMWFQVRTIRETPSHGCSESATSAQRQKHSSTARTSASELLPADCTASPCFGGAEPGLRTERKWATFSASRRRSWTCSTMSTSAGRTMHPFAFFFAGGALPLAFDAAAASSDWSAEAAPAEARDDASCSSVASAKPLWVATAPAGAPSSPAPALSAPAFCSAAAALGSSATRCSTCSAARTTRPMQRGQASAAGPSSIASAPAEVFCRAARPADQALQKESAMPPTTSLTTSTFDGKIALRTSASRKAASTTAIALVVSSAAG
mmetsp:Transcript_68684/g.193778  ORF Transcript_68684/g.193778 Transcript_68684/m.193778 type:complete len:326 (+) Transcript_68684:810-1787(+)